MGTLCLLLGIVLASAGWAAWYHYGRSSGQTVGRTVGTNLTTAHFSDSHEGLIIDRCQLNVQGTEAIATGTFNQHAVDSFSTEVTMEVARGRVVLGTSTDKSAPVGSGNSWQMNVNVKQGFGAPDTCYLGLY